MGIPTPATAPSEVPKGKAAPTPKAVADNASDAPKKPRKAKTEYGYSPSATIKVDMAREITYKGKRADYYKLLRDHNGKSVNDFEAAAPEGDSPRGWLRFFVQDGACTLETPKG